jgi:large subunit ribosomal protein L24
MYMSKLKIKKGDTVKVIAGEEKSKTGVVKEVLVKENRVVVEGVNLVKKHTKPSAKNPQGGIVSFEASIHISNVMLLADGKTATRVGRKEVDGKLKRFAKKTDKIVD